MPTIRPLCESKGYVDVIENKDKELFKKYREDGYCTFDFPDEKFEELAIDIKKNHFKNDEINNWKNSLAQHNIGLRAVNSNNKSANKIAQNEKIIKMLSDFYGKIAFPFQTLVFPVGTQQHFHSDSVHFSSLPERFMCGVWVALEDIDKDQGPLQFFPKSHKLEILKNEKIKYIVNKNKIKDVTQEIYEETWREIVKKNNFEEKFFIAKKRKTLIWAANLLHGGSKQTNYNKTRWSIVTHYYFRDCQYYTPMTSNESLSNLTLRSQFEIGVNKDSNQFDSKEYLRSNSDISHAFNTNPKKHWQKYGKNEKNRRLSYRKEFEEFKRTGYFIFKEGLNIEKLSDINKAIKSKTEKTSTQKLDEYGLHIGLENIHLYSRKILESIFDNEILLRFADYILEDRSILIGSIFLESLAEYKLQVLKFNSEFINQNECIHIVIPMNDLNEDNGSLTLIPGGHNLYDEYINKFLMKDNKKNEFSRLDSSINLSRNYARLCIESGYKKAKIEFNKGDALLFNSRLPIGFNSCLSSFNSRKLLILSLASHKNSNLFENYQIDTSSKRKFFKSNLPCTFLT